MKLRHAALLFVLLLCTACTSTELEVDPARYTPLTIGVLEYDAENDSSHLRELALGDTVTTQMGCVYNGEDTININLYFAYDGGTCTLTSEDRDVQISRREGADIFYLGAGMEWSEQYSSFEKELDQEGYFAVIPLGTGGHQTDARTEEVKITDKVLSELPPGRDYFLTATAYDHTEKKTIVTAKLKIVQQVKENGEGSRLYDITLVEYTLDDMYRMMLE